MELVPYLLCLAAGFAAGIFIEFRYGAKLSTDNAAVHAALKEATAAVTEATDKLKGA